MAHNTDIVTRAFVVFLKTHYGGKTAAEVAAITGLSKSAINKIYARAIARGLDLDQRPIIIRNCYFEDAPRNGGPTKLTEDVKEAVIEKVSCDQNGKKKTCATIAGEISQQGPKISATSVKKVLKAAGFRKKGSKPWVEKTPVHVQKAIALKEGHEKK